MIRTIAFCLGLVAAATVVHAGPNPAPFKEILIKGDRSPNGIFDPSIEYGPDGVGWMSYSSVTGGKQGVVETSIARSDDGGRTWRHVLKVNRTRPFAGSLPKEGKFRGTWWHEVSSLVYDPGDPGRKWKLFWHHYVARHPHNGTKDRMFALGWIAMRTAPSPAGPWSEETPLIGAGPFPFGMSNTRFKIQSLGPDYAPYIVLTEPGAMAYDGTLYMAMQGVRLPQQGQTKLHHDIILIASEDHGRSWRGVGRLLPSETADRFGAKWFTGASLVSENGRVFLLATPEVPGDPQFDHQGTMIFEFEDIATGRLKMQGGLPHVLKHIRPTIGKGGQADYDPQHAGGIVVPQAAWGNLPRLFRIYDTGERLPR